MKRDFAEQFTGWSFILAGVMFCGYTVLVWPHVDRRLKEIFGLA